jgi:hypothetical protein
VYYFLTEQITRTFIEELRKYWSYHPKYQDIVDNIQGKYSFAERPQLGIILTNSSGNQVQLAADNFQGTVESYVSLAHVENYVGLSIEWVREDAVAIQNNGGHFPSLPGIYFIELCNEHGEPTDKSFMLDPLLIVRDETPQRVTDLQWQLLNGKYLAKTLAVYQMPGNILLHEGINYTADPDTGVINLILPLDEPGDFLSADYHYPAPTTGPWQIEENRALTQPLPGAVLAFGRRITPGDRLAVVIGEKRGITALEYGGRWDLSLDMTVVARDVLAQREILDQSALYLWSNARPRLSTQGVEILGVSMGGETEEVYDENADDYFYNATFSLQLQVDWANWVPVDIAIRRVIPQSPDLAVQIAGLTDEEVASIKNNFVLLEQLGLRSASDPFLTGKGGNTGRYRTFEMLR